MANTPPSTPTYQGAAGPATVSSGGSNPNDIWGLGQFYGEPIGTGVTETQASPHSSNGQDLVAGKINPASSSIHYDQTQNYFDRIAKLWAAGSSGDVGSLQQFVGIQNALFNAGAYGSTSYKSIRFGQFDDKTQSALKTAIGQYEQLSQGGQTPMTFTDFLAMQRAGGEATGVVAADGSAPGSAGGAASQVSLADPAGLEQTAQQAAMDALGHGLSSDDLNKFVSKFHELQTSAQTSTGGSYTLPDASAEAEQFVQQSAPGDYTDQKSQAYMNAFLNMFLPSESQRANEAVVPTATGV